MYSRKGTKKIEAVSGSMKIEDISFITGGLYIANILGLTSQILTLRC